jgi:hypothetical protein
VELRRLGRCTADRPRPNAAKNSQALAMSASLQKADIRKSDAMEKRCLTCCQERTASPTTLEKHHYRKSQMRKSWRMVQAVLLATVVHVAPAYPVLAQDTKVSVGMTGIGSMTCAHWRSTKEHLAEGTVWIYGFWTGLNYAAAASDQAQSGTNTAEIVAEVKRTCAQLPSQALGSAVWTTYLEFNKR